MLYLSLEYIIQENEIIYPNHSYPTLTFPILLYSIQNLLLTQAMFAKESKKTKTILQKTKKIKKSKRYNQT